LDALKDKGIQYKIEELITINQLYEKGIRGDGKSLGEYSSYTKIKKQEASQKYSNVTLIDEGDFYDSVKLFLKSGIWYVDGETEKEDKDLRDVYGDEILDLTDENYGVVAEIIKEYAVNIWLPKQLLQ
jgi:hypothetical protein